MSAGIDYSMGAVNRDPETGIHYGVINQGAIDLGVLDSSLEPDYGAPSCPNNETHTEAHGVLNEISAKDWHCAICNEDFYSEEVYPESPIAFTYDADGYQIAQSGDDTDLFVLKSPYVTYTAYCSPCAPGAGHLESPLPPSEGICTYALGHDWFDGGVAPYTVFDAKTGAIVLPEQSNG